jgi:polyphosphate glucokinase
MKAPVKVLVVDVGGTGVKILASGQTERRKFPSGKTLTPDKMVAGVKKLAKGWEYDVVSIGYPGPVREGCPAVEPHNLAKGRVGFDFEAAFGCPLKMIKSLPDGCRLGDNAHAFVGGFRLWEEAKK